MPSRGLSRSRTFRCFSSGTSASCISSWPLMPRWAIRATAGRARSPAVSGSTAPCRLRSGIQRNLPRRTTSSDRGAFQVPDEILGAQGVAADGPRIQDVNGGDGPAADPAHQAAADHLNLGEFRHGA